MQHDDCRTLAADTYMDSRTLALDLFGPETGWKGENPDCGRHARMIRVNPHQVNATNRGGAKPPAAQRRAVR
jgi:hypothetical protein